MAASPGREEAARLSVLRRVTADEVFNLPLYEHHLVIDLRSAEDFSGGHVTSSVSFPSPPQNCSEDEREKLLIQFIRSYVREYMRPENPSPVLLYGDDTPETVFHSEWLAERLARIRRERKSISKYEPPESNVSLDDHRFNHFEHFCLTIADQAREIWILDCSYEQFAREYGFLCGHVEFTDLFPLPHRITKTVFLGSRVFPITKTALIPLGITHLIVSKHQQLDWTELRDISVLTCDVKDDNSQNMLNCWTASVQFISEAETIGGRVLVLVFGRSRSVSVVLAYLVKVCDVSVEGAWEIVRRKCWHLVDRTLTFEKQLAAWERSEVALPSVT